MKKIFFTTLIILISATTLAEEVPLYRNTNTKWPSEVETSYKNYLSSLIKNHPEEIITSSSFYPHTAVDVRRISLLLAKNKEIRFKPIFFKKENINQITYYTIAADLLNEKGRVLKMGTGCYRLKKEQGFLRFISFQGDCIEVEK